MALWGPNNKGYGGGHEILVLSDGGKTLLLPTFELRGS